MNMRMLGLSYPAIILTFLLISCSAHTSPEKAAQQIDSIQSPARELGQLARCLIRRTLLPIKTPLRRTKRLIHPEEETKNGSAVPAEESLLDTALELTETSQELWAAGDAEKAVEALDHAYELILKAPADAEGKSSQQKDDLRFVISKRLMEIYTSRLTAVNGLHKEIPLVMNEHVEREIKSFQTTGTGFFH